MDARLDAVMADLDKAMAPHDIKAGEQIYMLSLLLVGSIEGAPAEIRELFRGAVVGLLLREPQSGLVLKALCLDGRIV